MGAGEAEQAQGRAEGGPGLRSGHPIRVQAVLRLKTRHGRLRQRPEHAIAHQSRPRVLGFADELLQHADIAAARPLPKL